MHSNQRLRALLAATFLAASLNALPSAALAEGWTTVRNDRAPMVKGSGRVVQQKRMVGPFRAIEATGSENVEVRFGRGPAVVVSADDNIVPLITTEVRNGVLMIRSRGSYRTRSPLKIWIATPRLDSYKLTGSGNANVAGVDNDRLALGLVGSGNLRVTGRTGELVLRVQGSGNADVAGLVADQVEIALSGSGNANVRAQRNLDASVQGSGNVRYEGNPATVRRRSAGSGGISPGG